MSSKSPERSLGLSEKDLTRIRENDSFETQVWRRALADSQQEVLRLTASVPGGKQPDDTIVDHVQKVRALQDQALQNMDLALGKLRLSLTQPDPVGQEEAPAGLASKSSLPPEKSFPLTKSPKPPTVYSLTNAPALARNHVEVPAEQLPGDETVHYFIECDGSDGRCKCPSRCRWAVITKPPTKTPTKKVKS